MRQQFEYKVLNTLQSGVPMSGSHKKSQPERIKIRLNQLGRQGWELCGLESTYFIFKRRIIHKD